MTSRERVLAAIELENVDRLPKNYAAHKTVTDKLVHHLGVANEEELLCALGVDMRRIPCNVSQPDSPIDDGGYITNMWGVKTKNHVYDIYSQDNIFPFDDNSTLDDIHSHKWPDASKLDFSYVKESCQKYQGKYALFGSPWSEFFHTIGWMIGQENYFIWMSEKPEIVDAITTYVVDYYVESLRMFLDEADGLIDITYFGNDFGTQRGLFISLNFWERFIRKHIKRLIDVSKSYNCKVMFHSCGAVRELLPLFIEDGTDVIDPVQVNASEMNFDNLYHDFSSKICLHGGIDMQVTLPLGTVDDVRAEVQSRKKTVGKAGGYILAPAQDLMDEVPVQNILAMYDY